MTEPTNNEDFKKYEKLHYDKHIEFFKWMMGISGGAISIIVAVSLWFTYATIKDYKEAVKEDMDTIKRDVKEMKNESMATMKETNQYFERQIPLIKAEAEAIALMEVRKSISAEFDSKNIRDLIEATAEQKFSGKLDKLIEAKMESTFDKIDDQSRIMTSMIYATDQIRFGLKKGWTILDSIRITHSSKSVRSMALELQEKKRQDYEDAVMGYNTLTDTVLQTYIFHQDTMIQHDLNRLVEKLVEIITKKEDLNDVAVATTALRKITGIRFKMFDFDEVEEWQRLEYYKNKDKIIQKINSMKLRIE